MQKSTHKIHVLPENLINKIAAGEVIDRPASVIKELIENSIDAGAGQINLIIKGGGTTLIQVVDDGLGMSEEDAILSLQRHATSKINSYADLERIRTLGFRGEALASIAAVARVEMRTVQRGEVEGTAIFIEGGVVQKVTGSGGNPGTSIAVKNLFFNTPARRKFLRAESTEYRSILTMLNRFTLAFPRIGFKLVHDDEEVFNHPPASHPDRIADVLGAKVRHNLVEIDDKSALMTITGYIGNYDIMRKTRNDQYLFLNSRYINDRALSYAVTSAFGESLPKGHFPLFLIFLEIDPERVDVNVHPTKNEVKFADSRLVYDLVRSAVKRALRTDNIIPEIHQFYPPHWGDAGLKTGSAGILDELQRQTQMEFGPETDSESTEASLIPSAPAAAAPVSRDTMPIWQLQNKYILSQIKSGLVVIDQHVAHERILYERAKKNFSLNDGASQQLLFPHTIELSSQDYAIFQEINPFLEKIGFLIKLFGGRTVVIEGVPTGMRIGSEDKILLEILDQYKEYATTEADLRERVAKSFACRSAIMAGDRLTVEAMHALIDQLFATENPYFCPHGRPVMITISVDELDRRFDRK